LILGIVQGATEFIPVSSSGHLVLVPWLLNWDDPGLAFDAVLHLGTLCAVIAFFWRDLKELVVGGLLSIKERSLAGEPRRKIAWLILLGTIPAAVIGFALEDFFEALFAAPLSVGILLLVTGVLLTVAERWGRRSLEMQELTWLDALMIGLGQAVAIAPGISRSGATISAGLWRGLQREAAARYSFLLATPIILGAGLLKLKDLWEASLLSLSPLALLAGFLAAAISGFLSIRFLLGYLQKRGLYPFAVYCWAVGLGSISLALLVRG
jgi:undecaprenyl-diphosphatase